MTYDSREVLPGVGVRRPARGARRRRRVRPRRRRPRRDRGCLRRPAARGSRRPVDRRDRRPPGAGGARRRVLPADPSEALTLVGITGTNGKTTTAYLLAAIFEAAGCSLRPDRHGRPPDRRAAKSRPPAPRRKRPSCSGCCGTWSSEGCGACVDGSVLPRPGPAARRPPALRRRHLHQPDPRPSRLPRRHGGVLRRQAAAVRAAAGRRRPASPTSTTAAAPTSRPRRRRPVTYAIDAAADVRPGPLSFSLDGLAFEVRTPPRHACACARRWSAGRTSTTSSPRSPTAVALDVCRSAPSKRASPRLDAVPGRFQLVSEPADDVRVVVDYAHTDDALKNLLETARPLAAGRVITVFGCGGDRDRTKRPLMGAVAARLSDLVIVTSDNPRSEDPDADHRGDQARHRRPGRSPAAHAASALPKSTPCLAIVDRKAAIERAVRDARPGDLVLIAGKGHEKYQVDRRADAAVRRRRGGAGERSPGAALALAGCRRAWPTVRPDAGEVAAATGGALLQGSATRDASWAASRSTRGPSAAGDFFVAIRGERFDGHRFVAEALGARRRGSAGRGGGDRRGAGGGEPHRRDSGRRHDAGAAGPGARGAAPRRVRRSSRSPAAPARRRPRKSTAGVSRGTAIGSYPEQGQSEQPHRPAALAARAARRRRRSRWSSSA